VRLGRLAFRGLALPLGFPRFFFIFDNGQLRSPKFARPLKV